MVDTLDYGEIGKNIAPVRLRVADKISMNKPCMQLNKSTIISAHQLWALFSLLLTLKQA